MEGNREEEGVIPFNWVQDKSVRWPPTRSSKSWGSLLKQKAEPDEGWSKFRLVKVKLTSGKLLFLNYNGA